MTTILPEHAEHLYENEDGSTAGPWTFVDMQHIRDSRWHHVMYLVVRDEAGEHWGLMYRVGLTESQEHEFPWENRNATELLPLTRLYPHEVTKVEYRTKPPEPAATGGGSDG